MLSKTDIDNLRNRLEAAHKASSLQEHYFVDVPAHILRALLDERERLWRQLRAWMSGDD